MKLNHDKIEMLVRRERPFMYAFDNAFHHCLANGASETDALTLKVLHSIGIGFSQWLNFWPTLQEVEAIAILCVDLTLLGIEIEYPVDVPDTVDKRANIIEQFQGLYERAALLQHDDHYLEVWALVLGLAERLGIAAAEIEQEIERRFAKVTEVDEGV